MSNFSICTVLLCSGVVLVKFLIAVSDISRSSQKVKGDFNSADLLEGEDVEVTEFDGVVDFTCSCGAHLHYDMRWILQPDTLCNCPVCGTSYMLVVGIDEDFDDETGEYTCTGFSVRYFVVSKDTAVALATNDSVIKSHFIVE
jgi:hypothetical protein